jgi:hypothetical protein
VTTTQLAQVDWTVVSAVVQGTSMVVIVIALGEEYH